MYPAADFRDRNPISLVPPAACISVPLHHLRVIRLWWPVYLWLLAEALFAAYHSYLTFALQTKKQLPLRDHQRILSLFNRALSFGLDVDKEGQPIPHDLTEDLLSVKYFRKAFSAWFFDHPFEELSREDCLNCTDGWLRCWAECSRYAHRARLVSGR